MNRIKKEKNLPFEFITTILIYNKKNTLFVILKNMPDLFSLTLTLNYFVTKIENLQKVVFDEKE